jgi:hypothetical protein
MSGGKHWGFGRIFQRKNRRVWMLDYRAVVNGKTVRVRESSGTRSEKMALRQLRDKVAEARVARRTGAAVDTPDLRRVTLGEVLDAYLRDLRLREKKGAKAEEYRLGENSPLRQAFGYEPAAGLTRERLVQYAEARRRGDFRTGRANRRVKASNKTINNDIGCCGCRSSRRSCAKAFGRASSIAKRSSGCARSRRRGWPK